jgi:hypothetical protein
MFPREERRTHQHCKCERPSTRVKCNSSQFTTCISSRWCPTFRFPFDNQPSNTPVLVPSLTERHNTESEPERPHSLKRSSAPSSKGSMAASMDKVSVCKAHKQSIFPAHAWYRGTKHTSLIELHRAVRAGTGNKCPLPTLNTTSKSCVLF